MKKSLKLEAIIIIIILVAAFIVRLYKFDNPVADWHSWRQADTSAVTRNFIKFGPDLLHPRFDDLSNIPSGRDNPLGYRFVEFPFYNYISYLFYQLFNGFGLTVEQSGRLASILFSLLSCYLIYAITRHFWGKRLGLLSVFFFAFLPFNIYYSRTILPESTLVMLSLFSIYSFIKFQNSQKNQTLYLILFIFASSFSLLVKPTAIFLLFPLAYLFLSKFTFSKKSVLIFILSLVLIFLPFILWRRWISQYPEGIPVWRWLLNGDEIRFKGAFFYWLFAERISKLILGYFGISLVVLGLTVKDKTNSTFFYVWLSSIFFYLTIIATGNVKHDYYQIILIPILCFFLAGGLDFLLSQKKLSSYILGGVLVIFTFAFSWYHIRTYYWINKPEIVKVGKIADQILPKNAKVIAPYGGDTAFLYQTNRQGWPIGFEIEEKIKKGADYYISLDPSDWETRELLKKYSPILQTNDYAIIKLQ